MQIQRDSMSSIGYLTNYAGRLLVRALERRLDGKSAGPMPVFLALNDGGALPQKELARLAAVEQPPRCRRTGPGRSPQHAASSHPRRT